MNLNLLSQLASQTFGLDLEVMSVQPTQFTVKVSLAEGVLIYYPKTATYELTAPKERLYKDRRYKDHSYGHEVGELTGSRTATRLRTLLHELWTDRNVAPVPDEGLYTVPLYERRVDVGRQYHSNGGSKTAHKTRNGVSTSL